MGFVAPLAAAIAPLFTGLGASAGVASGLATATVLGGTALAAKGVGSALAPRPQQASAPLASVAPSAPKAPTSTNLFGTTSFFPASEGTQGGTFLTGRSGTPTAPGAKKTLLGQ